MKITDFDIYQYQNKYWFEDLRNSIEGEIVIGNGVKSTGETYPYVSHVESDANLSDEEHDNYVSFFDDNLDEILNSVIV